MTNKSAHRDTPEKSAEQLVSIILLIGQIPVENQEALARDLKRSLEGMNLNVAKIFENITQLEVMVTFNIVKLNSPLSRSLGRVQKRRVTTPKDSLVSHEEIKNISCENECVARLAFIQEFQE